jgi:hypothetical protein
MKTFKIAITVALFCFIVTAGCGKETATSTSTSAAPLPPDALDEAAHAHPEHGPHGGDLVELGNEEYHAEVVHGDNGFSVYVLDGSAKQAVAVTAEKLVVSLKQGEQVKTFEFAANPDTNDESGKSSRFTSTDEQLHEWLDAGAEGALTIEIEGKSYTGKVTHDHAH